MKKIDFNKDWLLNGKTVTLPRDEMFYTARRADSKAGDAQAFFEGGAYAYEKKMGVDAQYAYVNFDGIYKNAKVYLNEELKADVPYGYIPFTVELGEVRKEDVLKVTCDNLDQPDSRWYAGAGIYRDVTLYTAKGDHILPHGIKVETLDYKTGKIHVSVKTSADEAKIEVYDQGKKIAEAKGNDVEITVPDHRCWSENDPYLYDLKVSLKDDEGSVRFGIRQIEKTAKGLEINGVPTLLKGGCVHHDNGLLGAATYYKSEYRRMKILKGAGFNAIRSAHNPASDAMLRACDELGLYVMDETWDMWFNHKNKYDYASKWEENHMKDIEALVERDYNHPSVILYSIGNEVSEPGTERGLEDTKEMVDLFHELDKTRLVTAGYNLMIVTNAAKGKAVYDAEKGGRNEDDSKMSGMNSTMFNMITSFIGSGMNKSANSKKSDEICSPALDLLDLAGYNYASGRYPLDQKLHPDRLIFGSETMPYDIGKNWKMVETLDNLCGDFMWTAWDYVGENGIGAWAYCDDAKGFSKPYPWWLADTGAFDILGDPNAEAHWAMATWRTTDKPLIDVRPINHDHKVIKAAWRGTNGIPSYSFKGCEGRKMTVEVFYDCVKIDLYQNGKKVRSSKVKENRAVFKLNYVPGTLEAVALDQNGKELCRNRLVSAKKADIVIRPEEESVKLNDLVYVRINVEDEDGIIESNDDRKVRVEVENGELLSFGSANPRTIEDCHTGEYKTYYGRAMAIVKAGKAGKLIIKADDGKHSRSCTIEIE